jgi:hypothetical protein
MPSESNFDGPPVADQVMHTVTLGWPTVTRMKTDPWMGIEQGHFLVCRDSSIRSSRNQTGST